MDPNVIVDRLMRFVRLDTGVFEEMRDDATGTIPALIVAAISFLLSGIGGYLWWLIQGYQDKGKLFAESLILGSVFGWLLWLAWVGVAFLLLANVFHYTVDMQRMIRSCSFATVPLVLGLLMFIPGINLGVGIAVFGLFFLLMDIGIQVSVDAQPGHVIAATFLGFVVFCFALSLLATRDDPLAPNVFLFRPPATAWADLASAVGRIPRLR